MSRCEDACWCVYVVNFEDKEKKRERHKNRIGMGHTKYRKKEKSVGSVP